MRIPLDQTAPVPLWGQIEQHLRAEIESGALPADTRLPSTRALAEELAVSRITVERAYQELAAGGLIVGRPGSGSYVASRRPAPAPQPPPADLISFTGVGDPALFPAAEIARTITDIVRREGSAAFGYAADPAGYRPLRATIAQLLAAQGIRADADEVLVTSGSQQALALVCQHRLRRGDTVLVERPTYDGALDLFASLGLRVVGVDVDAEGLQVDQVARVIDRERPGLIYTIPTFQNPSGASMTTERRHRLLEVAAARGVLVVEDDFVGDLRYDGPGHPSLKSLDAHGNVVYLGTFSKMLMPGLRVGYLVARPSALAPLAALKHATDMSTSLLMQMALDRHVTIGRYQAHLARCVRRYRQRRDAMVEQIATQLPGWSVAPPAGGLFLWAALPAELDSVSLTSAAGALDVRIAAGTRFFAADPPDPTGLGFVRLNFAANEPARIAEGVHRLAAAAREVLAATVR